MALICHESKQIKRSREFYEKAVEIYKNLGKDMEISDLSEKMGLLEAAFGDQRKSISLLTKTVKLYRTYNAIPKLAKSLKELGSKQLEFGMDGAIATLQESSRFFSMIGRDDEVDAINSLIAK